MTDDSRGIERFDPASMAGDLIDAEHQARYRLALLLVSGRRVLDAGCGVGWGTQLIVEAGAAQVIGVDIAPEAIRQSRERCPQGRFVVGDLGALPLPAASVDVVVCFETIEHTRDARRALDELRRVLRPDGVVLVSSPNPAVYPAGNPYHVHELPPAELLAEVQARFGSGRLLRQHLMVSSLIYPDGAESSTDRAVPVRSVARLAPGHDPYSVVVAGADPAGTLVVAPSHQLDALSTLASAVQEERAAMHTDHARILTERERLLAERAQAAEQAESLTVAVRDAQAQLSRADAALRQLTAERDSALLRVGQERDAAQAALAEATQRAAAAAATVTRAEALAQDEAERADRAERTARERTTERDHAAAQLALLRAERDQAMADLVRAEQAWARATAQRPDDAERKEAVTALTDRVRTLGDQVDGVRDELDRVRATVSWRVTVPLRRVRRAASRRPGVM
jgi:O-antigen biosynthesis protein